MNLKITVSVLKCYSTLWYDFLTKVINEIVYIFNKLVIATTQTYEYLKLAQKFVQITCMHAHILIMNINPFLLIYPERQIY